MDFCFFFHRYCSAGCRFSCSYTDAEPQQDIYAKGDEYHKFRECAKEHWDSMRSYFQKNECSSTGCYCIFKRCETRRCHIYHTYESSYPC
ncbi:uncharacterized protein LOC105783526 isoform X2 [Gossypium raimondii]|uniref:uncharacterized protein LOC105783526 isoform X2 n=1 Tax=Gossypium raimondii TaxID=29730 RepID=UPI00227B067C|nr:uncharacterized protein LOC105783526 isoform X2 [Gossypium raimondii]